ncbi:MAG TPA: hypothetical protein PK152_11990 [Anaerolineales bacterium]|jgi:hypothetical protein|nr:hypothetical protein [Anaerolineales bacterium]
MKLIVNQSHVFGVPAARLGWWPPGWQLCLSCRLLATLRVLVNPWAHISIGSGVTIVQ